MAFLRPLSLCSLLLFLQSFASADTPPPRANNDPAYAALRTVGFASSQAFAENVVVRRDIATITFRKGTLSFLAPVEGRVTGAVFVGEGEIRVEPAVSSEKLNLANLTKSASFSDTFTRMVLRFTDGTFEQLSKETRVREGVADPKALDALSDFRKLLRKGRTYTDPNLALVFVRLNLDGRLLIDVKRRAEEGLFFAYFDGKQYGDSLFGLDPLGQPFTRPEEVVLVNLSDKNLGIWVSEHLQAECTAAPAKEDSRLIDAENYKIEATAKGSTLAATVTLDFKALLDGVSVLPFDLYSTLRMQKITDQAGRELSFIQEDKDDDPDFFVVLAEPLEKGESYQLKFEYEGKDALEDSGGGNFTLIARSSWYPNNGFGEDRANFDMTLKTPKGLTMVATGQLQEETKEGDWQVTRWKSTVPLGVAGFNYGKFKKSTTTEKTTNYVIETYANKEIPAYLKEIQMAAEGTATTLGTLNTVSMMEKAHSEAEVSINLFSNLFGPLPYGRIALSQQPSVSFGQAWPMLVYMPLSAFLDVTFRHQLGLDRDRLFYRYVAAHEVSHQWWGHIIGWESYRDQWLSEGLAEFSASLFAQAVYKKNSLKEFWKESREGLTERNKEGWRAIDAGSVNLGYRLNCGRNGSPAVRVIYNKGGYIVHMLRMMMWDPKTGDERFFTMMKDFVKTHLNQNVSTADFARIVEKHMTPPMDLGGNGKMDWFFRQWVEGNYLPEYRLDYRLEPNEKGQTRLILKVTQANVDETFRMPVPIYLQFKKGTVRLGVVHMVGNSTADELTVDLPEKPEQVLLNAQEDVLCTMKQ